MKRIATVLAALGLFAGAAHADDRAEVKVKNDRNHKVVTKKHTSGRYSHKAKVEKRTHHRLGGGTVSTTKSTDEVNRPGLGNDTKRTTTDTVERDANGNVVRHERKLDK